MTQEQLEAAREEFARLLRIVEPPLSDAEIAARIDRNLLPYLEAAASPTG